MMSKLKSLWKIIRQLSGDDAYEIYLKNFAKHHCSHNNPDCTMPLSKAEFFKQWQDEKWQGIKRCC